jgi:hypothetical protein
MLVNAENSGIIVNRSSLRIQRPRWRLEPMRNAALLQHLIGGVAGFDFPVNRHMCVGYGAVPNVVVALAMPHEMTAMRFENVPDFFLIFSHYKATCS